MSTHKPFSDEYVRHRRRGPFPGHIDPWAEVGRYFQQIHGGMIGLLLDQIQDPLIKLGYEAGRETSLQILERSEPDLYVWQRKEATPSSVTDWDYASAAQAVLAQPGVNIQLELPELDAIFVRDFTVGTLIAVVEIISPSNKADHEDMNQYRRKRESTLRKGVNVMEIDPTRSVKRLLQDKMVSAYAYHVAIYLPRRPPRVIGVDYAEALPRVAVPLRGEVVPMELQQAYDTAYWQASIAGHIHREENYVEAELPFPSLLTGKQKAQALEQVQRWQDELKRLAAG